MNFNVPDMELNVIPNTAGNKAENDGIAYIIAQTRGQNQNGEDVIVWAYGPVIFSTAIHTFSVSTDKTILNVNETANLMVRLFDTKGNPVAAGSKLTVSTNAGELSRTELIPAAERWGLGTTFMSTQLTNNLDPESGKEKTATVKFELTSPNGDATRSVNILLRVN
jgi:hypothetical protein